MSESAIKFCCGRFEEKVVASGRRGVSIVPHCNKRLGINYFVLTFRIVDQQHEMVPLNLGDNEIPVTRVVEQSIQFCPWCGSNLREYHEIAERFLHVLDDIDQEASVEREIDT